MTVSQALAAHACAQIAAAKDGDQARRSRSEPTAAKDEPRSFIESWRFEAKVIGWSKAAH